MPISSAFLIPLVLAAFSTVAYGMSLINMGVSLLLLIGVARVSIGGSRGGMGIPLPFRLANPFSFPPHRTRAARCILG